MFTENELLNISLIHNINAEADIMAGIKAGIPDNKPVSQWNNKECNDFRFYFNNFKSAIIEGLFPEIEEKIRREYIQKENELNYTIILEESFNLPDYKIPLNVFIDRSCKAKNKLIEEYKQIVLNAINEGVRSF